MLSFVVRADLIRPLRPRRADHGLSAIARRPIKRRVPSSFTERAMLDVAKPAAKPAAKAYTPQPIQGVGWAPFRYPLQ